MTINHKHDRRIIKVLTLIALIVIITVCPVFSHCDSEDGPIQFIRGTDNQPYLVVQGTVIQRSESFSDDEPIGMIRFFKVNGVQTCERCLENMLDVIGEALDE